MKPDWKKAVVHLEAAADSATWEEQQKQLQEMWREMEKGEHPAAEIAAKRLPKMRDRRYRGTAVFVAHEGNRYLVTARHVLTNADHALGAPGMDHYRDDADRQQRIDDWIFPIVFRVPTLDEVKRQPDYHPQAHLMNLGAGVPWMHPYTFSEPALDLAVVSLRSGDLYGRFADELESTGYLPVSLDDIGQEPSADGAQIYSVGYPDATAVLGQRALHPAEEPWASAVVSVPVFAFGRVAMLRDDLHYFLADMSVYPGNSGGPVIEGDRMVGIVSAQAAVEDVRIPFGTVIKSVFIRDLIEKQVQRDQGLAAIRAGSLPQSS
ncbi:MAG: serine protease [Candidatus Dormibacteraeota bacterium]|nr:serine protease [Candidatus Dormibacteraeota bacterium]